jgi:hypothetical protein
MQNNLKFEIKNPTTKICGIFFILFLCSNLLKAQSKIEVVDAKKSFGFVKKGEIVKINYEVKNIGNAPLLIDSIEVSCSCTTSEFSKKPILPNATQSVTLIFNTTTTYDRQDRTALLHSNGSKTPIKLRYKGVVLKK